MASLSEETCLGVTQARTSPPPGAPAAVLLVDDDPMVLRSFRRSLCAQGHTVVCADDGSKVPALLRSERFETVVSDISMAGLDGFGVLREVHAHDPDLPVLLVTGGASLDAAIRALELGAHRFLLKPLDGSSLAEAVREAVGHHRESLAARLARGLAVEAERSAATLSRLGEELSRAMKGLWVAFQPIVRQSDRGLFGFEALVRSRHAALETADELLRAAEHLQRLGELERAVHARVAGAAGAAPSGANLLVNLHPWDLRDEGLLAPGTPLTAIASRVVLEITERASLDGLKDTKKRVTSLRQLGYRIAVDDLGAGYAGLSSFALLEPEVAKLDMSIVRGVDTDVKKQSIVRSMAKLCGELGVLAITEGVETPAERSTLSELGCDLLQGYLFARPDRGFPAPRW